MIKPSKDIENSIRERLAAGAGILNVAAKRRWLEVALRWHATSLDAVRSLAKSVKSY